MRRTTAVGIAALAMAGWAAPAAGQPAMPAAGGGMVASVMASCPTDLRVINQISGWPVRWPAALESAPVDTPARRRALLEAWAGAPAALEEEAGRLRRGLAAGREAPRPVARRVLAQVEGLVELGTTEGSPLMSPALRASDPAFRAAWAGWLRGALLPAVGRYRDVLRDEIAPASSPSAALARIPGGEDCFRRAVRAWTSLDLEPAEVRRRGEAYLAELEAELRRLAGAPDSVSTPVLLEELRRRPPGGAFATREELVAHAEAALARARAAAPAWFGHPGDLELAVEPMPRHMETSFPAGIYRPPGSAAPARYVVNTSGLEGRRTLSEAIAFHEGIPGHHLFGSAGRALGGGSGAFNAGLVEGWALYAERLADEMGLYSTPADRLGLVLKHLWAASRLVVEPGLQEDGWDRARAVAFMMRHTALPRHEIELEVDRYMGLPGQSLAYVLGYLELRRIRAGAESRLGDAFDVRAFHDAVLRGGSRPLSVVEAGVAAWVARRAGAGR